jgi:hypothetical protein
MLSRSSIFLKLIGSFYEQVGATDFTSSFDDAYSNILYSRYADIIVRAIASKKKSSIFNAVRLGFIRPMEIDVSRNYIKIVDINNRHVEDADFISLSSIDADKIYKVVDDNGNMKVDQSAIMEMAESSYSNVIPVMYGTVGIPQKASAEWISIHRSISSELVRELTAVTLESISKFILYRSDSRSKMEIVSNILLGAMYSYSFEEVIMITDDIVYTNKNEYTINDLNKDKIIVSVGDRLEPMELISRVASITNEPSAMIDVQRVSSYMLSHGLSLSNIDYLNRLSEAVVKRKLIVNVDASVISSTDKETLEIASELIGSFAIPADTNSEILNSDTITVNHEFLNIFTSETIADVVSEGRWELEVVYSNSVAAEVNESIIVNSDLSTSGDVSDDDVTISTTILDTSSVDVSEKTVSLIADLAYGGAPEDIDVKGELVETSIAQTSDSSVLLFGDEDTASFDNVGKDGTPESIMSSGVVTVNESFYARDNYTNTISASSVGIAAFSDVLEVFVKNFEYSIVPSDSILISYLSIDSSTASVKENSFSMISDSSESTLLESLGVDTSTSDDIRIFEYIYSYASSASEDIFTGVDSISTISAVESSFVMEDSGDIESNTTIDD